ncbi:MAG: SpoIVB peptidase [Firmicutes bacterium]|nr:SpoIVB peptidase [Alicyclobacillaceae bacterium]MCL6496689.1 SpoIVB peptidase [Bacillota bacterium]
MAEGGLKRWVALGMGAVVLGLAATPPVEGLATWPRHLELTVGSEWQASWWPGLPVAVAVAGPPVVAVDGHRPGGRPTWVAGPRLTLKAEAQGRERLAFNLWGWLPGPRTEVDTQPAVRVVPGGEAIGVVVHVQGLLVTGWSPIVTARGPVDPARAAGIRPGDILSTADGQALDGARALSAVVQKAGAAQRPVVLTVLGARGRRQLAVVPTWSPQSHRYRLGVLTQDRVGGVGTLTFVLPSGRFAALGHSVTDGMSAIPAPVREGRVLSARIVGIRPQAGDRPGEKIGVLERHPQLWGIVTANGRLGVTGRLKAWSAALRQAPPMPVALPDQVHPGPATVWTVVRGDRVATFQIQILRAYPQAHPDPKGIAFRVTDPRLLAAAGGVVQGMSGSPIVQDGMLVGAVTHVVEGDPAVGYGCYAWWMVQAAERGGP